MQCYDCISVHLPRGSVRLPGFYDLLQVAGLRLHQVSRCTSAPHHIHQHVHAQTAGQSPLLGTAPSPGYPALGGTAMCTVDAVFQASCVVLPAQEPFTCKFGFGVLLSNCFKQIMAQIKVCAKKLTQMKFRFKSEFEWFGFC